MSDDEANRGEPDLSRLSGKDGYEVEHLAKKHGIHVEVMRRLIDKHGDDRATLDAAAARMRSS